jgi:hypothetical protein
MTYRIGNEDVAVRSTSRDFGEWIDRALGAYRVRGGDEPPEYSVVIDGGEDDPARIGRRFHILYQGVGSVIRTMNLSTLARSIIAELDTRLLAERDDAVYAHYGVAWTDEVTVLLPAWLVAYLSGTGRRLHRSGINLSVSRWVAVDRDTGEILPQPRFLDVPGDAFAELPPPGRTEPDRPLLSERRHVDAVLSYVEDMDTIGSGTRGLALHHLAAVTANLPKLGGEALEPLARLVEGAHCFETGLGRAQQMLQVLSDIFEHERAHLGEHGGVR